MLDTVQRLERFGGQTVVARLKYKGKMMVAPREFLNLTHWRVMEDGAVLICARSIKTFPGMPEPDTGDSKGYVRADLRIGGWYLQPLEPAADGSPRTRLVYLADLDLMGGIPEWIMKIVLSEQPLQVNQLQRILRKEPDRLREAEGKPPLANTGALRTSS